MIEDMEHSDKMYYFQIQANAQYIHKRAVRIGILPELKILKCCDCGAPAKCYDHRDYYLPLDVASVCYSCNIKRGMSNLHLGIGPRLKEDEYDKSWPRNFHPHFDMWK